MNAERNVPDLLSGRALFRLGLGMVVIASALFLRYSIEQGWIGPEARVGLAAAAGLTMVIIGLQLAGRRPAYGTLLQGGGAAILYLTAFAAHNRYELVGATEGFLLLVGISAAMVTLAVRQRVEALAVVGIIGGLAAPVSIGGRIEAFPGDAGYLLVVAITAAILYWLEGWGWVYAATAFGLVAVVVTDLLRTTRIFPFDVPGRWEVTLEIALLWLILWPVSLLVAAWRPTGSATGLALPMMISAVIPFLTYGALLFVWEESLSPTTRMTLALGMATTHLLAWHLLSSKPVDLVTRHFQLLPGAGLMALGWVAGLDGAFTALALAAQATAMIALGTRLSILPLTVAGHTLFAATAGLELLDLTVTSDRTFDATDVAGALIVVLAGVIGVVLANRPEPDRTFGLVYGAAAVPAGLLWASASLGPLEGGQGMVTAAWSAEGIGLVIAGKLKSRRLVRNAGIGVVLLAVGKLLLADTATVSPVWRMALFAGVGAALLGLGYWLGDGPVPEPEPADGTDSSGLIEDGRPLVEETAEPGLVEDRDSQ